MSHPVLTAQLDEELLYNCMKCGFCKAVCPTFELREIDTATPRGRIGLIKAVHDGKLSILDIQDQIDLCLGCRACEPACPAGVQYGQILEQAKVALTEARPNPWLVKAAYKWVLGTPGGIKFASWGISFYQRSGLRSLARGLNLVEKIGGPGLAAMEASIPDAPSLSERKRPVVTPAASARKLRIGFFLGCISEIVFYETNSNAIEVLSAAGCEVEVAPGQGCCGAVHSHAGEHAMAVEQAKRNIAAFEQGNYDYVVGAAGGCGAALREYHHLLADDPEWAERAAKFSHSYRDFSELLVELEPLTLGEMQETFTYQDSCHLRNVQKVAAPPRKLLKSIPGATFVELPQADHCCGAAGTYSITQSEVSDAILDKKVENVKGTGATTVVVANPPCQLEMIEGVQRARMTDRIKVRHIADVLAEALRKGR